MRKQLKEYPMYEIDFDENNQPVFINIKTSRVLKQGTMNGYKTVQLCKDGKYAPRLVHRLVAETFIENPENKPTVNHINHIRNDNRISNLEWATMKEQADEITHQNQKATLRKLYDNTVKVTNGDEELRININELDDYEDKGYWKGSLKSFNHLMETAWHNKTYYIYDNKEFESLNRLAKYLGTTRYFLRKGKYEYRKITKISLF